MSAAADPSAYRGTLANHRVCRHLAKWTATGHLPPDSANTSIPEVRNMAQLPQGDSRCEFGPTTVLLEVAGNMRKAAATGFVADVSGIESSWAVASCLCYSAFIHENCIVTPASADARAATAIPRTAGPDFCVILASRFRNRRMDRQQCRYSHCTARAQKLSVHREFHRLRPMHADRHSDGTTCT